MVENAQWVRALQQSTLAALVCVCACVWRIGVCTSAVSGSFGGSFGTLGGVLVLVVEW